MTSDNDLENILLELKEERSALISKCNKAAYLLGLATGSLLGAINDEFIPSTIKVPLHKALDQLYEGIDDLYYNKDEV
jgi:hypothetical protein